LARSLRSGAWTTSINRCFGDVIRACAENREEGTWITSEMIQAYEGLHRFGCAHSLEVWQQNRLVGGIYGVAIGAFFAGESMFHRETDASKVALVSLRNHLLARGFELFDTQIVNDHTAQFGAIEIPRPEYLRRLSLAVRKSQVRFRD
jgi:leucyl/phenylalanyl-tRNA--protein transferase